MKFDSRSTESLATDDVSGLAATADRISHAVGNEPSTSILTNRMSPSCGTSPAGRSRTATATSCTVVLAVLEDDTMMKTAANRHSTPAQYKTARASDEPKTRRNGMPSAARGMSGPLSSTVQLCACDLDVIGTSAVPDVTCGTASLRWVRSRRLVRLLAHSGRWHADLLPCHHVHVDAVSPRFLTPADVAEVLAVTPSQVLKYLRDRELRGIKLPGKGEWRIETSALEEFIRARYVATQGDDSGTAQADSEARR